MSATLSPEKELQLEAYKTLVSMLQNDDTMFWTRNNVLIAINGGMLTVIGLMHAPQAMAASASSKAISVAICAIGVIACIIWLLIAKRSEAFYDHWYEQLKYLEREYLVPIRTFQIADEFFARGHITLGKESFKLDPLARVMRMFMAMQFLATTFSIVWFCLGLYLLFLS